MGKGQYFFCVACVLGSVAMVSGINDSIFRQYDIRGVVGSQLPLNEVSRLGRAVAAYLIDRDSSVKKVVLGMDGRTHSPQMRDDIARALVDSGLDVISIGVCSTPVMYFGTQTLDVQAGLMVTASHNTKEYNGLKIRLGSQTVWGEEIQKIRQLYQAGAQVESPRKGLIKECDIIPTYVDYLAEQFGQLNGMTLPVVFDCGNGTVGPALAQLAKKLNWAHATMLYAEVDGSYPHHEADPTVEKNMLDLRAKLRASTAAIGIGFDGDGDRMAAMTPAGRLIPGDEMLAILAQPLVQARPSAGVVCDVSCSQRVLDLLSEWGARGVMVPTGSPHIKKAMKGEGVVLGGEISGHYIFGDRFFGFDDGLYAVLRLLELMVQSGKTIDELASVYPRWCSSPIFRPACADEKKKEIVEEVRAFFEQRNDAQVATIDGVRVTLPYGSAIIRASNTQPALSMRFEATTLEGFARLRDELAILLETHVDVAPLRLFDGGTCC